MDNHYRNARMLLLELKNKISQVPREGEAQLRARIDKVIEELNEIEQENERRQ